MVTIYVYIYMNIGNIDYDVIMKHDFFKGMDLKLIWNN
jgi:hypothetical protein